MFGCVCNTQIEICKIGLKSYFSAEFLESVIRRETHHAWLVTGFIQVAGQHLAFLCRGTLLSSKYINYEIALEYIFEFKIALEQIYK